MSSGEHASRSASPRTSPKTPGESSPYQTGLRGGGDSQTENRAIEGAGIPQPNGEPMQQSLPLRSLGVHTILNPAEIQPNMRRSAEGTSSSPEASSAASSSSPHMPPPFPFQGPVMTRHGPTTPTIDDQHSTAPSSVERFSPSTTRPFPPFPAARRVLTPRSPRFTSPGQSHPFRALNPPQSHPQHLPAVSQDAGRAIPSDAGAPGRSDQPFPARALPLGQPFRRVASPANRMPPNITPLPPSTRSNSQPGPSHPNSNLQARPFFPGTPSVQPGQPSGYPPPNSCMSQAHSAFPANGGDHRWPAGNEHAVPYNTGGVRSFAFGEGQAALRIQPAHGEAFIVPVDTHQGSRQADEKRQRNAGASQRFRKRKKDRETQERIEHQRMESQYRELEARIQTLEQERDRLRSDRDRLREIVYRTPSVSDLAYQGPPSPGSRPQYGAADPETGERPSQRRRTDPHPQVEYASTSYTAPGSLPPIATSAYPTSLSHPGTPSAMSQAPQLPPLRLGSANGTPTTAASAASTPVQAYQQPTRESYETGWAAGSRASTDPSQRRPPTTEG